VGAGNVMLDIARFLIQKVHVDEVIAVVRRGPAEVKFTKKELEYVVVNLDRRALDEEFARVAPQMQAIGQDPEAAKAYFLDSLTKAMPSDSTTRLRFEFLVSPLGMSGDENGVAALELEDNALSLKDGEAKARGTGNKRSLAVDSVVFAIGDKVDEGLGLPLQGNEFARAPEPRFPVDGISYESFNPETGSIIPDIFMAGWSRQASTGLVGYARKDGTQGSKAVLQYLQTLAPFEPDDAKLSAKLKSLGKPIVKSSDVRNLSVIEQYEAHKRGVQSFKFGSNDEMLEAIMSVG
jgi:ferredoxin--NADP+ reductase